MPDLSLLTTVDEIRGKTLKLVQIPLSDVLWHPVETDNHILWHAGHIFAMVERLAVGALQEIAPADVQIPKGWWRLFGWGSDPGKYSDDDWPPLREVYGQLQRQYQRIQSVLPELTDAQLSQPLQNAQSGWNGHPIRRVVIHAFHDEACHGGEIWLLRKMIADRG